MLHFSNMKLNVAVNFKGYLTWVRLKSETCCKSNCKNTTVTGISLLLDRNKIDCF